SGALPPSYEGRIPRRVAPTYRGAPYKTGSQFSRDGARGGLVLYVIDVTDEKRSIRGMRGSCFSQLRCGPHQLPRHLTAQLVAVLHQSFRERRFVLDESGRGHRDRDGSQLAGGATQRGADRANAYGVLLSIERHATAADLLEFAVELGP